MPKGGVGQLYVFALAYSECIYPAFDNIIVILRSNLHYLVLYKPKVELLQVLPCGCWDPIQQVENYHLFHEFIQSCQQIVTTNSSSSPCFPKQEKTKRVGMLNSLWSFCNNRGFRSMNLDPWFGRSFTSHTIVFATF